VYADPVNRSLAIIPLLLLFSGCDRKADPLEQRIEDVILAISAGETVLLTEAHTLATPDNEYCRSPEFARVLTKLGEGSAKNPEACKNLMAASQDEIAKLEDEARLLFQIARLRCEDPTLDCQKYGKRVLISRLAEDPIWRKVQGKPSVLKVLRDEDGIHAAAYVEFTGAQGKEVRALKFTLGKNGWMLSDGFPQGLP